MGKSKSIKNALIGILEDVTYNGEPAFTEVVGHPHGEFNSYPSVRVLPGDQTTKKASTQQNDRTVSLIIRTHVPVKTDGSDVDYTYDLTDLIIDTLDTADTIGAMNVQDPTLGTLMLNATRGDWIQEDSQRGPVLMCDVNVEVLYSRNN